MKWPTLKNRRQFDLVYSQGRKCTSRALVMFHLGDAPDRQVAFVASRKVGGAVQRNRAKRLMREAFRRVTSTQPVPDGWFVLIARVGILDLKSDMVARDLSTLMSSVTSNGSDDSASSA